MFVRKSLFESIGYSADQINAPQFQPNPQDWNGRTVYVYWRPGNKDLQVYRELLFMGKETWDGRKAKFEKTQSVAQSNAPIGSAASGISAGLGTPQAPSIPKPTVVTPVNAPINAGLGTPQVNTSDLLNQLRG